MAIIKLDKQNKIQLLKWLQAGEVDSLELSQWLHKNEQPKTEKEIEDEIVRLSVSIRNIKPIYEDQVAQRVCKGCYDVGGCWLSWMARDDRELQDKIRAIFENIKKV